MLPLPYLLGYEEAVQEEEYVVLKSLEPSLLGYPVEGKDIDVDALMHLNMLERGFREATSVHADLHEIEGRVRLGVRSLQEVAVAKLLLCNLGKAFVVRTHHSHIHIIVPRQNLLPEVRTNGCTTRHEVTDAMLPADAVHLA